MQVILIRLLNLKGDPMKNAVNWFEIPVTNFKRGIKFYGAVLEWEISEMPHPTLKYSMLPYNMPVDPTASWPSSLTPRETKLLSIQKINSK